MKEGLGAFLGAFFAFIFLRFSEMLTRIYKRQNRNYNAIVKIEHFCCEKLDLIRLNIVTIEDFMSIKDNLLRDERITFNNWIYKLNFIQDEIFLDLIDIDFMNEILAFKIDIDRFDNDTEMVNRVYESYKCGFMEGKVDFNTYKLNTIKLLEQLEQLKKFLVKLEEKTIYITACAMVISSDCKPFFTRILHAVLKQKYFNESFNKRVSEKIKRVKLDREKNSRESQEYLEKN